MSQQQKRKQEIKYVLVQSFIEDQKGFTIGVKGVTWPTREPIEVVMDNETEKAKNAQRRNFNHYARGFKVKGEMLKIEPGGALLRLRCVPDPEVKGRFMADWINVEVKNRQELDDQIRMGLVLCKAFTPSEVRQKRKEICASPEMRDFVAGYRKENGLDGASRDPRKERDAQKAFQKEVEARLAEAMPGKARFNTSYYLYEPAASMKGSTPEELRPALVEYFFQPEFQQAFSDSGQPYRPVKPHLIVRCMDENGQFTGRTAEFMPEHSMNFTRDEDGRVIDRACLTAEECADHVVNNLPNGAVSWNILPAKVYTHSLLQMRLGQGNEFHLQTVSSLNEACHEKDQNGERIRSLAIPMALNLNAGDIPVVRGTLRSYDPRIEKVNPVAVDRIEKATVPGEVDRVVMLDMSPEVEARVTGRKKPASAEKEESVSAEHAPAEEEEDSAPTP